MKLSDFLENVDIQSQYRVVYYDECKNKRVETVDEEASDKEIKYVYVENGILYIEVEVDE